MIPPWSRHVPLQRRHNGHHSVSSHQPHDCCLHNRLYRQIKENIKARCHWPVIGEFPSQIASNAENVSTWWRHHAKDRALNLHDLLNLIPGGRLNKKDGLTRYGNSHVIKWIHLPRYWPFVWGIHRFPMKSPHKGQWRGILMFSLICTGIIGWVINAEAGDLRRHRAHYDVIVMKYATEIPVYRFAIEDRAGVGFWVHVLWYMAKRYEVYPGQRFTKC